MPLNRAATDLEQKSCAGSEVRPLLQIDCYGYPFLRELTVETSTATLQLTFDPQLKHGRTFHCGLFVDRHTMSSDVSRYPRERRIGALMESPINPVFQDLDRLVRTFPLIFTHWEDLTRTGLPFAPLIYGTNWISIRTPEDAARLTESPIRKTGLVSFIGSIQHPDIAAYRLRREVSQFLLTRTDVECFGKGIREVSSKRDAIAPFLFSVAMENVAADLYFTEKLVDCILLETVPIYYGCQGIDGLLDPRGFLRFQTLSELEGLLPRLTVELYQAMRPALLRNRNTLILRRWYSTRSLMERVADDLCERIPVGLFVQKSFSYRTRQLHPWVHAAWRKARRLFSR